MKKVKMDDVDDLTRAVIEMGIIAAALLAFAGCPVPAVYEHIEKSVRDADKMREGLELDSLAPEQLTSGELSQSITHAVEMAQKAYRLKVGGKKIAEDLNKMN